MDAVDPALDGKDDLDPFDLGVEERVLVSPRLAGDDDRFRRDVEVGVWRAFQVGVPDVGDVSCGDVPCLETGRFDGAVGHFVREAFLGGLTDVGKYEPRSSYGYFHRQASVFCWLGSTEMTISSVGKWSLQPWPRTQPRLTREEEGLLHSPSVRTSMPSQRPRFLGSLTNRVGASKSVPPPRTRLMSGLVPRFHSNMASSATV